ELLYFYLHIGLPEDSGITDKETATSFFQQFEILVEASIIDSSTLSAPSPAPPAVYRLPPGRSHGNSTSTSPSAPGTPLPPPMDKRPVKPLDGTVICTYIYNPNLKDRKMVVFEWKGSWSCIVPLAIPVAYIKTRAQTPALALCTVVTQIQSENQKDFGKSNESDVYSVENFGMMNLLDGLNNDPLFESSTTDLMLPTSRIFNVEQRRPSQPSTVQSLPQPLVRRYRKILSVKSALNVRMRTTSVSPLDHVLMMSVELENNTDAGSSFSVEAVKVEIAHGFVTRFEWEKADKQVEKFPLTLNPVDQVTFLYSITILDDPSFPKLSPQHFPAPPPNSRPSSRRTSVSSVFSSNSFGVAPTEERQRHVSIVARGSPILNGVKSRSIESRWNCVLDLTNLRRREDNLPLPIPNYNSQRPTSITSKNGQSQSSSRSTTVFSPTGSTTPTANRNFYLGGTDVNGRGKKQISNLPAIPDQDAITNGILSG
ncbi:18209_t:CDS:2, partial [Acaulospora morrowiae]